MRDGAAGSQQEPGEEDVPRRVSGQRRDRQRDRERGEHAEHGQAGGNNEQSGIRRVQFHKTPGTRTSSESRSLRGQDGAINLKNRERVPILLPMNATTGAVRLVTVKALLNFRPYAP